MLSPLFTQDTQRSWDCPGSPLLDHMASVLLHLTEGNHERLLLLFSPLAVKYRQSESVFTAYLCSGASKDKRLSNDLLFCVQKRYCFGPDNNAHVRLLSVLPGARMDASAYTRTQIALHHNRWYLSRKDSGQSVTLRPENCQSLNWTRTAARKR